MNQKQEMDLWEQISIPSWMLTNSNNLDQHPIFIEQNQNKNEIIQKKHLIESDKQIGNDQATNRKGPLNEESEYNQSIEPSYNDPKAEESPNSDQSGKMDTDIKNKLQRRCENSKKYRERKKQYFKSLQEQNNFLKFKVQELTFRLHEMQMQINRLKHNDPLFTHNFHTVKSECLNQIEQLIANNADDINECIQVQNKLNKILAFDGKQKIDYLNYFMNELLENVINDRTFYFIDCLIHKRGVHREGDTKLRKIDLEVFEILKTDESLITDLFTDNQKSYLRTESKRLQQLWKKLYQVYLAILNQGLRVEKIVQSLKTRLFQYIKISDYLKLQLHFEQNKHRADIRSMRNSWFKEVNEQQACKQTQKNSSTTKKTKLF